MYAYCGNNPVARTDASGNSWFSSLITAVAIVAVAAVVAVAVVASAGAVACAAAGVAAAAGASASTVAAVSTAATVGCYAVAGGVVATGLSDAGEVLTGTNVIRDYVFQGNQKAYDTLEFGLTVASAGIMEIGYMAREAGVSCCFVAGTFVLTKNGQSAIESIHAGDYVWAWDESTRDVSLKQVVETYISETTELTHIFVDGEEIVCTPTHPFYAPQKGWTDACKLRAGDILVLVNGEYAVVEKVQHELLEYPIKVYNFQVEDYHTYYVSSGVLVHNKCGFNNRSVATTTDDALSYAEDYLGPNYYEDPNNAGRFVSQDGIRAVRMSSADLATINNHAGAPHINFDILSPKYKTFHVYLLDQ